MNVGANSPCLTRLIANRVLCFAPEKFEGFCGVQNEAVWWSRGWKNAKCSLESEFPSEP
jgi:hypothetical protein